MSRGTWSFWTTRGLVTVGTDEITIRSTPGRFLTGQSIRWRTGDRAEQLKAAFVVLGFVVSIAGSGYHLVRLTERSLNLRSMFYLASVMVFGYSIWSNYGRTTTITRSAIESVTVDTDSRELTINYETGDDLLRSFRDDGTETSLTLSSDDELRDAQETFRLRGIAVDDVTGKPDRKITHRIVAKNGGYHCESCDALVTPNDKVCRDCGDVLWDETSSVA